jgi:uncharacterized protein
LRYPITLIIFTFIISGISLQYTIDNLGVNTNTGEMLSPDLPFQKNRKRLESEFPQDAGVILLVVEAETPEETSMAAVALEQQLSAQTEHFNSAYIPTDNAFFRQQALLYLELDELDELARKLTDAQPFIGYLSQHYSLEGLFSIITEALKQEDNSLPMDLGPLLNALNETIEQELQNKPAQMSWQKLLAVGKLNTESNRTLVLAQPKMRFNEIMPAEHALTAARATVKQVLADNPRLRIRITGETALEHEELESVAIGATMAGIVSLILVCTSLMIALRSVKLLIATFIVLILGLILTAGFATLAIGHLNLISIAFAVLYIGLGVDYALHICLHYRECRAQGMENNESINHTIETIGISIFLCALTTSLGFLAFIPTDYSGVSELGIISGAGMLIGLTISLTVLPAFLKVLVIKNVQPIRSCLIPTSLSLLPFRQAKRIRIYSVFFALASAIVLTQLEFDSNPINLRDPNSESVSTIRELLQSQTDSPFALASLTSDLDQAKRMAEQLEALPSVHQTIILPNLVAEEQDEKLYIIEDLSLILGNQLQNFSHELKTTNPRKAIETFAQEISTISSAKGNRISNHESLLTLTDNLYQLLKLENADTTSKQLEQDILGLLPYTMERLRLSLTANPYSVADLPSYIRNHWLSPNGLYKILIMPQFDQNQVENLKQFVAEVQTVDPAATGLPVADQASGTAVVKAFIEAFGGALIAITVLLLIMLKNVKHTLLVIGPLLLASMLTGATNVLLNNPFNFANIIALPLLMGMGVDSGIHILHRLKSGLSGRENLLQSSSARGVFFSSLTTLCSFTSLAFTTHVGTASMGLLLAIGITFTLLCTLIVLPAFFGNNTKT